MVLVGLTFFWGGALVCAQAPVVKALTLTPATAPVPALKYELVPPVSELTPGNAATIYYRALTPEFFSHRRDKDIDAKMERWRTTSLKVLPQGEMGWLRTYRPLRDCDEGARRQNCDWDLHARLRKGGALELMGDLQVMRELARLLQLRARLEMAAGQADKAVYTLQTSLALARHVGESPTLIGSLIGTANATRALDEVEEMIQQPEAPNLYWALTTLPQPLIDLRQPLGGERLMVAAQCADVRALAARPLTRPELDELQERLLAVWNLTIKGEEAAAELATRVEKVYPEAHKKLIQAGFEAEDLKAFPHLQVVLLHALREYHEGFDNAAKWLSFPYWQARPHLEELKKHAAAEKKNLLYWLLSPLTEDDAPSTVLAKIAAVQARTQRRIAVLRCIEAIRLHAAQTGRLPATLADITVLPVPSDPVTGKEFEYQLNDKLAIVTLPAPIGVTPASIGAARYELTLSK
jgi:hypothetical protein